MECITVRGARANNLCDIDIEVPKRQLVVFTGVSGSGKSSLVFDTIAAEAQRQLNETFSAWVRQRLPHYGTPDVDNLVGLLDRMVDSGNTVVVVEHSLDVVARADWVIDLGPEGGALGGRVQFEGTPSKLARTTTLTGRYLRQAVAGGAR
jgi:excinuclease UvrABC ATPase subunit